MSCNNGSFYSLTQGGCVKCPDGTFFDQLTFTCHQCQPGTVYNNNTKRCDMLICKSNEYYSVSSQICKSTPSCSTGKYFDLAT